MNLPALFPLKVTCSKKLPFFFFIIWFDTSTDNINFFIFAETCRNIVVTMYSQSRYSMNIMKIMTGSVWLLESIACLRVLLTRLESVKKRVGNLDMCEFRVNTHILTDVHRALIYSFLHNMQGRKTLYQGVFRPFFVFICLVCRVFHTQTTTRHEDETI